MTEKNLELIWAQSSNNIIGINGKMPWHIKEDLEYFKKITLNKSVIMGKNTWNSLYIRPLPKRENIILTSKSFNISKNNDQIIIAKSLNDAIKIAKNTPIIIGGGAVFNESIEKVKTLFVTNIHKKYNGDVFAPKIPKDFKLINKKTIYSKNKIKLEFMKYERFK